MLSSISLHVAIRINAKVAKLCSTCNASAVAKIVQHRVIAGLGSQGHSIAGGGPIDPRLSAGAKVCTKAVHVPSISLNVAGLCKAPILRAARFQFHDLAASFPLAVGIAKDASGLLLPAAKHRPSALLRIDFVSMRLNSLACRESALLNHTLEFCFHLERTSIDVGFAMCTPSYFGTRLLSSSRRHGRQPCPPPSNVKPKLLSPKVSAAHTCVPELTPTVVHLESFNADAAPRCRGVFTYQS